MPTLSFFRLPITLVRYALVLCLLPSLSGAVSAQSGHGHDSDHAREERQIPAGGGRHHHASTGANSPAEMLRLGDAYASGDGVTKDLVKAFDLFIQAARAGDPVARLRVGRAYHQGEGTDSNQISAWVWSTLASREGSPVKVEAMALRQKVSQRLTSAQQERAQLLVGRYEHYLKP
ncbi:MAG: hypothetical protein OXC07_08350 [Kistimonas sp.]|nr:hypothetical protein [Kistimonas sp.]